MSSASLDSLAVIGGGVIGLTSAIRLLEAGYQVSVYASAITPHTTSDVAAAYWAPGAALAGEPMRRWALTSLTAFQALMPDPESGIRANSLYELSDEPLPAPHGWLPLPVEDVPPGRFPAPWSGFRVVVPQIDVPIYMPWLLQRFRGLGGKVQLTQIEHFAELAGAHQVIVNCTGLGAQRLTGDTLFPIRGQVIRVRKPPGLAPEMIIAETHSRQKAALPTTAAPEVTYIIPRSGDCLLGGTFHVGDARKEPDAAIAAGILARCAGLNPLLRNPEILEHRVGLRPGRRGVRLAQEPLAEQATIIHNYGHGALGHTFSWGCAAEVVRLVKQLVN